MRKDNPLAARQAVKPEDLFGMPLIVSRRGMIKNEISSWLGGGYERLDIAATYNLIFNAALMVEEGVGSALALDGIVKMPAGGALCFRPLEPRLKAGIDVVWKKLQVFSKAAGKFLEQVQKEVKTSLIG
jgi:hypothetical protein